MVQKISSGSCNPDGVVSFLRGGFDIPLLLLEYKRSIGEGGYDPSVQAAYSLQRFLYQPKVCAFHQLPTLLCQVSHMVRR